MRLRYQTVVAGVGLILWSAACVASGRAQPARLGWVDTFGPAMRTADDAAPVNKGTRQSVPNVIGAAADTTEGTLTVVAQNGTRDSEASLTILAGTGNPIGTIDVPGSGQNLPTLQVLLRAASQEVSIDRMTIGFGDQMGDEDFVDTMRVQLIADTNANGTRDEGDTDLGTHNTLGLVDTITFDLTPSLILPANSETTLLVLLDLNSPGLQTARRPSQRLEPLIRWGLLLPAIFALLTGRRLAPRDSRPYLPLLIAVILWSVIVLGCSGKDGDDELTFIVNLPSNGLTNQSVRLGPAQAIPGATIRLTRVPS